MSITYNANTHAKNSLTIQWNLQGKIMAWKKFEGEMFIRILQPTLFQIFGEIIPS